MFSFLNPIGGKRGEGPRRLVCVLVLHCAVGLFWGIPARSDETAEPVILGTSIVARANKLAADIRAGRHPGVEVPSAIEHELKHKRAGIEDAASGLQQSIRFYRKFEESALRVDLTKPGGFAMLVMYAEYMQRESDNIAAYRQLIPRRQAEYVELYIQLLASRLLEPERNVKQRGQTKL